MIGSNQAESRSGHTYDVQMADSLERLKIGACLRRQLRNTSVVLRNRSDRLHYLRFVVDISCVHTMIKSETCSMNMGSRMSAMSSNRRSFGSTVSLAVGV